LIIFTLSDPSEKSLSFLNKVFGKDIMSEKDRRVAMFNLNPPTEKSIEKVLKMIAHNENIAVSDKEF